MLALSLYLLNSGQSVDLRCLTEHTLFMMYMEVDVYWTLCGIYFLVFYCQIKDRSRHAAKKEAFLSCGAHILRSTSLGFSTVDVALGLHPDLTSHSANSRVLWKGWKSSFSILVDNEMVWSWAMSRC